MLNQMPDQVRHDGMLNQSRVGARDDIVQHDGIAGRARNDGNEILKQVQDDEIAGRARNDGRRGRRGGSCRSNEGRGDS